MIYNYGGSITAIVGPMCGGKTSRLITEMRKNKIAGKRVLLIKHPDDNRYDDEDKIITHDQTSEVGYRAKNGQQLFECGLSIDKIQTLYDVVCIDEGQFYKDVDLFCEILANVGIKVYVSALIGDFRREPFYNISRLLALSESIVHAKAVDRKTGDDASFTRKLDNSSSEDVINVGGLDMYEAVGRHSYFSN
jgi:thymidine kinase